MNNPRFNSIAAENLGFDLADITRALSWIESNPSNEFAASLARQLGDGLTYPQWAAVIRAANGGPVPARRRAAKTTTNDKPADAIKQPRARLSPADRTIARRAITLADGWTEYMAKTGINSAALSGDKLYDAADALGVDVAHALADNRAATRAKGAAAFGSIGEGGKVEPPAAAASGPVDWQRVRMVAREEAQALIVPKVVEVVVVVDKATGDKRSADAPTHPQFSKLVKAASLRDFQKQRLNVVLVGPTGTGKSFACRQLAKLLGLPFYFQSQASEGFDLVGYERVNGVQKVTPFVQAFRDGGVCLLDEIDRYDPKASTALNSALANGEITLDNGEVVKRHTDFVCVASGNTFGMGASADFTAAEKMDLSTISRFPVRLDWHVHADTERAICEAFADNAPVALAWLEEVRAVRRAMERQGLPYLADQRCVEAGANLLAAGMDPDSVREVTYLASLDADQRKAVLDLAASKLVRVAA